MGRMNARRRRAVSDAFEVDHALAPVTVLRLKTADVAHIEEQLRDRAASLQQKFPYAPVVVDVAALDETSAMELPLHDLADRLRACRLIPVGAANLPPSAVWNAAAAGIAVVELAAAPTAPVPVEPPRPKVSAEPAAATMTVRQPVRSGQVIYAHHADLIVMAPVNAGAQVIADGHIHVYGPLRGRALAGAKGKADALVFCQSLEAELVAIAGHYLVADAIPAEHRGSRAQLSLESGQFRIQPL
jgi:septum site-determining protein MinC